MLKEFDKRIREFSEKHGIDYPRAFARSLNVFYQNYDLYVKKDPILLGILVTKAEAEVGYDNPK